MTKMAFTFFCILTISMSGTSLLCSGLRKREFNEFKLQPPYSLK